MIGITDTYASWCLDEAVQVFGASCEEEMEKARKGKGRAEQKEARAENALRKMLGVSPKFRDITELLPKG